MQAFQAFKARNAFSQTESPAGAVEAGLFCRCDHMRVKC
jgi:hypothetical protein